MMNPLIICLFFLPIYCFCWEYLLLVQIWPPSVIYNSSLNYPYDNNYFVINSVIPLDGLYNEITYCNCSKFNIKSINDIYLKLNLYWTNFYNTTNYLEYIYYKYCGCTLGNSIWNPIDYFSFGLYYRKFYDMFIILLKNNIIPNNIKTYNRDNIMSIINSTINIMPIIMCENGNLNGIILCFNKNLQLINCPIFLQKKYFCDYDEVYYKEYYNIH